MHKFKYIREDSWSVSTSECVLHGKDNNRGHMLMTGRHFAVEEFNLLGISLLGIYIR